MQQVLHPRQNGAGIGGGGGGEEFRLAQARGGAVIEDETIIAQHHAVAQPADFEGGERVAIQTVEEFGGVRPLHGDLAEGGDIDDADIRPHMSGLAQIGGANILARLRIIPGTGPGTGIDESGAMRLVPILHRGAAGGTEMRAEFAADDGAEGNRRVGRAERGGANITQCRAAQFGKAGEDVDVGGLALIGRHAAGGVTLGMLDGDIALAMRQIDIAAFDVMLQIDKGGHRRVTRLGQNGRWHERLAPPPIAGQRGRGECADVLRNASRRPLCKAVGGGVGQKGQTLRIVDRTPAALAPQMQRGREARGGAEHIAAQD